MEEVFVINRDWSPPIRQLMKMVKADLRVPRRHVLPDLGMLFMPAARWLSVLLTIHFDRSLHGMHNPGQPQNFTPDSIMATIFCTGLPVQVVSWIQDALGLTYGRVKEVNAIEYAGTGDRQLP